MAKNLSPEWTPSHATDFTYLDGQRSGQRIVGTTDEGVEVSVPHLPYEKWIDKAGNVLEVPVSTNRQPKHFAHQYAATFRNEKRGQGWLLYSEVPEAERERCSFTSASRKTASRRCCGF